MALIDAVMLAPESTTDASQVRSKRSQTHKGFLQNPLKWFCANRRIVARMAKAQIKTKVNDADVQGFLNRIGNAKRREDAFAILEMMKSVTRKKPRMWGASIVGFDEYH